MTSTVIIKDGTFKKMLVRKEGEENILCFGAAILRAVIFESSLTRKETLLWKEAQGERKELKV